MVRFGGVRSHGAFKHSTAWVSDLVEWFDHGSDRQAATLRNVPQGLIGSARDSQFSLVGARAEGGLGLYAAVWLLDQFIQ